MRDVLQAVEELVQHTPHIGPKEATARLRSRFQPRDARG